MLKLKNNSRLKPLTLILALGLVLSLLWQVTQVKEKLSSKSNYLALETKFNQSQWRDPRSTKPIDDDTLYHYAAFYLVKGGSPFMVNPEVPPWGKYFYGLSIKLVKNPYWMSLVLYFSLVGLVGATTFELTQSKPLALAAALTLANLKLITFQLTQSMLDLPLAVFLLLNLYSNLKLVKTKENSSWRFFWFFMGALGLGWFAGTKFPWFLPALLLANLYFFYKHRKLLWFLAQNLMGLLVYILGYTAFFIQQPDPLRFIKSILWGFNFYKISKLPLVPVQWLPAVFKNHYFSPSHQGYISSSHWSVAWPGLVGLSLLVTLRYALLAIKKQLKTSLELQYLMLLTGGLLALLSLVNFWERYLVLLLPLMTVLVFSGISRLIISRPPQQAR